VGFGDVKEREGSTGTNQRKRKISNNDQEIF